MLARAVVLLSLALGAMAGAENCSSQCKSLTSLIPGCDLNNPTSCSVASIKCTKDDIPSVKACYDCMVKEGALTQDIADMTVSAMDSICTGSSIGSTGVAAADASGSTATGSGAAAVGAPSSSPSAAAAGSAQGSGAGATAPIAAGAVVLAGAAMFL